MVPGRGAINGIRKQCLLRIAIMVFSFSFYSAGITRKASRYKARPGTPPGSNEIKNARRNQKALIPKNSERPPQTPATTRLWRDLRRVCFDVFTIFIFLC